MDADNALKIGVLIAPLITALIQLMKLFKVPSNIAPILVFVFAIGGAITAQYNQGLIDMALQFLISFLMAFGFYEAPKQISKLIVKDPTN